MTTNPGGTASTPSINKNNGGTGSTLSRLYGGTPSTASESGAGKTSPSNQISGRTGSTPSESNGGSDSTPTDFPIEGTDSIPSASGAGETVPSNQIPGGTGSTPSRLHGVTPSTASESGAGETAPTNDCADGTAPSGSSMNHGADGTAPSNMDSNITDGTVPSRKRPAHPPPVVPFNRSIIIFVTVCTQNRQPLLATPRMHELLVQAWKLADQWLVGRYVIMPDHIHLFCSPGSYPIMPLKRWVAYWKSLVSRAVQGYGPLTNGGTPSMASNFNGGTPSTASEYGAGETAPSNQISGGTGSTLSSAGKTAPTNDCADGTAPSDDGAGGTAPSRSFMNHGTGKTAPSKFQKLWQRDFWDTQLRRGESYSARWNYVRHNPVRAGLVPSPELWPFQGELNVLIWHD